MWQCLEKIAAVAGGCVVAAGTGGIEAGTAVGAAMGAAGIVAFFGERSSRHGPESSAHLLNIRRSVLEEMGDFPEWSGVDRETVEHWDWSLGQALPACMLDRRLLAESIVDRHGFPIAATNIVLEQLIRADDQFRLSPAKDFASRVISSALTAAYEDRTYFETLSPYLWAAIGKKIDDIKFTGEKVSNDVEVLKTNIAELIAIARNGGIFQQASANGISEDSVRRIVERLGGEGITNSDLLTWLEGWIIAAERELGKHNNEGEAFEAAHREAERRFREGHISSASQPLMALLEREQAESGKRQITILDKAINFDLLGLELSPAVDKLRLLSQIASANGPEDFIHEITSRAEIRYFQGRDQINSIMLLFAIAAYRMAIESINRALLPREWAATQDKLGIALLSLGERESGPARIQEAVAAHRLALEEMPRAQLPLEWASIQNNLGNALAELGGRESSLVNLHAALTSYRLALEESPHDRFPLHWATAQNNIANVLMIIGDRNKDAVALEESCATYRLVLEHHPRTESPRDWSKTQNNIGNALLALGDTLCDVGIINDSINAYRLSLEELSPDEYPLDWAKTKQNLGRALLIMGSKTTGTDELIESVACYLQSLQVIDVDTMPLDWTNILICLSQSRAFWAERDHNRAGIDEAYSFIIQARQVAILGGHEVLVEQADLVISSIKDIVSRWV